MLLLIGGTGFVGRSVQRALRVQEIPFQLYDGDVNDFNRLRDELEAITAVIHLASGESRGRRRALAYIDVDGTDTLVKVLRQRKIDRLIVLSRINADRHAHHPLLQAKGIAEQMIAKSPLPYTIIRSATLFGRTDRFTNAIAQSAALSWPFVWLPNGGTAALQPLWVEDIARIIVSTLGRDDLVRQTITVAGEERIHYKNIVESILTASQTQRMPVRVPTLISKAIMVQKFVRRRPPINNFDIDRLAIGEVTDLDTVSTQFKFRPERLRYHLAHLRRKGMTRKRLIPNS